MEGYEIACWRKKADKGSCVVVWDKKDYKTQADKQLSDTDVKKDFKFNEKILRKIFEESNIFLKKLSIKASLQKKALSISSISARKLETLQKSVA